MTMPFNSFKYGNPIYHTQKCDSDPTNIDPFGLKFKKIYKISVRVKLKYHIEIYYYEHFAFVKFYPKVFESYPDKYKKVGMKLTIREKRMLLNTCCDIVYKEIKKTPSIIFAFIAQVYDRDNVLNRLLTVRFSLYKKQVTTFFNSDDYVHFNYEPFNFYCITKIDEFTFIKRLQSLLDVLMTNEELSSQFMTDRQKRNAPNLY